MGRARPGRLDSSGESLVIAFADHCWYGYRTHGRRIEAGRVPMVSAASMAADGKGLGESSPPKRARRAEQPDGGFLEVEHGGH